jgi:hypothetical protein
MVLYSVVLDVLPHLLDGAVECPVRLLLARNEVACVVGRFVRWAPGLFKGCGCGGSRRHRRLWGGERKDAGVGVCGVHLGECEVICLVDLLVDLKSIIVSDCRV